MGWDIRLGVGCGGEDSERGLTPVSAARAFGRLRSPSVRMRQCVDMFSDKMARFNK